jgi:acylphosphatase
MMDENAPENVRLHALVEGHVQGVGFRYYVQTVAQELHLTGWVRNTYDGSVEVLAEGPRTDLEMLVAFLRRGPRSSFVSEVQTEWKKARSEFDHFDVSATV